MLDTIVTSHALEWLTVLVAVGHWLAVQASLARRGLPKDLTERLNRLFNDLPMPRKQENVSDTAVY